MKEEEVVDGLGAVRGRESEGWSGGKVTGYAAGGDETGHG